jgi:hypothetical protein
MNQMDWRSVVSGVGSVGMAKPMGANRVLYASSFGRSAHDYADAPTVEQPPAPGWENGFLRARDSPESGQFRPQRRGQGYGPRAAVLAEGGNLAGVASRTHVAPKQPTSLRKLAIRRHIAAVTVPDRAVLRPFPPAGERPPRRRSAQPAASPSRAAKARRRGRRERNASADRIRTGS